LIVAASGMKGQEMPAFIADSQTFAHRAPNFPLFPVIDDSISSQYPNDIGVLITLA
jgi:hypothetical protein